MDYNNVYAFAENAKNMTKIDLWEQYQIIKRWDTSNIHKKNNKMDFMYACAVALECKYRSKPCIFKSSDRVYIIRACDFYDVDVNNEKANMTEIIRFYLHAHKIKEVKELEKATIVYDLDKDGGFPNNFYEDFLN